MAVFRSASRNLRVSFPAEQFGMGDGVERYFDNQNVERQKQLPHRAAKFSEGLCIENKPNRIDMLRKHPGNKSNNGGDFWEESQVETQALAAITGKPMAIMPQGGLTMEDMAVLRSFEGYMKVIPPKQVDRIVEKMTMAWARFQVTGIQPPVANLPITRMRARLIEFMGLLSDLSIYGGVDADAKQANIG